MTHATMAGGVSDDFPDLTNKAGTTPFISKMHSALERPEFYGDCLRWSEAGTHFLIDLGQSPFVLHSRFDFAERVLLAANPRLIEKVLPNLYGHHSVTAFTRSVLPNFPNERSLIVFNSDN